MILPPGPGGLKVLTPTSQFQGLYVIGFQWYIPEYVWFYKDISDYNLPATYDPKSYYYNPYLDKYIRTKKITKLKNADITSCCNNLQSSLIGWARANGFNSFTLSIDELLACSRYATGTAFGDDYFRRPQLETFITNARSAGINYISAMESNEEWFIPGYPDIHYNPKAKNPKDNAYTIGSYATVALYDAFRSKTSGRFDGIQLELDWWNYGVYGSVGFTSVTKYAGSHGYTENNYVTQANDIYKYVNKADTFSYTVGGKTFTAKKPVKDVIVDAYFARDDFTPSFSPPSPVGQMEVNVVLQNSDRIMLANDSSSLIPDFSRLMQWNQLYYIAQAAKSLGTTAQVIVIFYCNNKTRLYNYFDRGSGNHSFLQAYLDLMAQYNSLLPSLLPLDIPYYIQFIGYQIYAYDDAKLARP